MIRHRDTAEPELVRRAVRGDAAGFAALYEKVYKDLYRFALYTLKNSHDAEDVVSDTVLDAWVQIRDLRRTESFRSWIFRILTNKCRMRLKRYMERAEELPEELAEEEADYCTRMDVRTAFSRLADEERLILALNIFGGYTSREIGQFLQVSPNTVRSKQSRALKKMATFLERDAAGQENVPEPGQDSFSAGTPWTSKGADREKEDLNGRKEMEGQDSGQRRERGDSGFSKTGGN